MLRAKPTAEMQSFVDQVLDANPTPEAEQWCHGYLRKAGKDPFWYRPGGLNDEKSAAFMARRGAEMVLLWAWGIYTGLRGASHARLQADGTGVPLPDWLEQYCVVEGVKVSPPVWILTVGEALRDFQGGYDTSCWLRVFLFSNVTFKP